MFKRQIVRTVTTPGPQSTHTDTDLDALTNCPSSCYLETGSLTSSCCALGLTVQNSVSTMATQTILKYSRTA